MKRLSLFLLLLACSAAVQAQSVDADCGKRYVEVVGSSVTEIDPDEVHFIITISEYWAEEFDGKSKPEEYRTKVPLATIESSLRRTLAGLGIGSDDIRTQEVGEWWRERGKDFLISKQLDISLPGFDRIGAIVAAVDTRGVQSMRIGELKHRDMAEYRRQGKIEALKAARDKAAYLAEAMGQRLGDVLRIIEPNSSGVDSYARFKASNSVLEFAADGAYGGSSEQYRKLVLRYEILARFELLPE